ncbi:hypothetical protein ACFY15_00575 [Streptomyces sp. NPDC001373]|uniref:hypothetical protein n=1 Tax=Streptomyces sp. NPDC001373 TaxID=3364565 RepID=UPI0036B22ADC
MTEYGIFEDSACIEAGFHGDHGKATADDRVNQWVQTNPEMVGAYAVLELCPDHEEQPKHGCEECATDGDEPVEDDDESEEDGDAESAATETDALLKSWVPSREACLRAARVALTEMPVKWRDDPAYWVGRLGQALKGVMHHVDAPAAEVGETGDDRESASEETPEFAPVAFHDVHEGDRVRFVTANNGFGGGDDVWRTGTVVKVTDKTVTVEITGPNPLAENVFVGGKSRKLGRTASLRRTDWQRRCVSKAVAEQPSRRPYNAENVRIVDEGAVVTAVWVSDPTIDPSAALENILRRDLPYEVEVIAEASRFYKRDGADFSGWVVAGNGGNSDGIPNKREAMKNLGYAIRDHFTR